MIHLTKIKDTNVPFTCEVIHPLYRNFVCRSKWKYDNNGDVMSANYTGDWLSCDCFDTGGYACTSKYPCLQILMKPRNNQSEKWFYLTYSDLKRNSSVSCFLQKCIYITVFFCLTC